MKKIIQSVERVYVDPETGEEVKLETSKVYSERVKEDSFYMTFIDFIAPLYKLSSDSARKLLTWMCEHAEYNTGKISLATGDRLEIASTFNISNNTITNSLAALKKLGLISGSKGRFEINPQIFWKGDLLMRKKLLKDKDFKVKFVIDDEEKSETTEIKE